MSDLLGGDFSSFGGKQTDDEIDFDRAASAFPDISIDGSTELPSVPSLPGGMSNSGFSFDDFDEPPSQSHPNVKVTGDDEIDKFESEFPEIDVPQQQVSFVFRRRELYGFPTSVCCISLLELCFCLFFAILEHAC